MQDPNQTPKGRATPLGPANRFGQLHAVVDDSIEPDPFDEDFPDPSPRTTFLPDASRSIVSENDSPDIFFRYSINPYRGCEHGCSYCYARPSHEYLGLNAGLDFETRIFVKERAPELFRDWLARPAYEPEVVTFSGITDCYQPIERRLQLTRRCLEVALEARQPIGIVTKNALVTRDVDLLSRLAELDCASVALSINSLDDSLARAMEPRTSRPSARLNAIRKLSDAGIPMTVMVAPVIPGLNDIEIPAILEAARDHGADRAGTILLRLPYAVKVVFLDWLDRNRPTMRARVEGLIRQTRHGELNNTTWGERMRGQGEIADQIGKTFRLFQRKYGLDGERPPLSTEHFRPPQTSDGQMTLF